MKCRKTPASSPASGIKKPPWWPDSAAARARFCGSPPLRDRTATIGSRTCRRRSPISVWTAPFRSAHLWAFFDSAYRSRVDLDYFAPRWRKAGISALHVAAWHYWEPDPQADEYLRHLIDACHRNAIQVYAWVELPHVSERFWDQHPEWREKTALLQDAQLDWRKLMNLTNRAAFAEAARGLRGLMDRFDWDGVNLAELYFESLEGHENPARFTPMNDDVRAEFQAASGIDPLDLFNPKSPQYYRKARRGWPGFSTSARTWLAASRPNGSPRWKTSAKPNPGSI